MTETIPDVSRMVAQRAVSDWSEDKGRVTVRRRRFGPARGRIVRLFGVSPVLTIHLDPLGSEVWRLLDGVRTVGQVRAELERTHPGEPDMARRLGTFIGAMVSRKMIVLRPG